jgi:hypothetical protein
MKKLTCIFWSLLYHSHKQNNKQTTDNKQRNNMSISTSFNGWPMTKVTFSDGNIDNTEKKMNTWTGPDGNTYEHNPITNILYDIENGDYLGDKDEFKEYLERIERFEPWTAPNGKTYNLDPVTNYVYDDDTRTYLGDVHEFEQDIKEKVEEEKRERYEREPHIMIDNWGGPMIDVRDAGPSTDFVVNQLVDNLVRLRNINKDRAKILRAFVKI